MGGGGGGLCGQWKRPVSLSYWELATSEVVAAPLADPQSDPDEQSLLLILDERTV